jgi:hypothetical protein
MGFREFGPGESLIPGGHPNSLSTDENFSSQEVIQLGRSRFENFTEVTEGQNAKIDS